MIARDRLFWTAFWLLAATALYNVLEGILSILAGVQAGSVTLVAFGADSYLEVAAAAAVIWRLMQRDAEAGERAEERALRFIGWSLLVLALAVAVQSLAELDVHHRAEASPAGLILVSASVVLMAVLALWKLWAAARGHLPIVAAEARETIACCYLSLSAFVGLLATALLGWWWLDAGSGLVLVVWLVREAIEGVRGDACFDDLRACFCRPCIFGLRDCPPGDGCVPACC